MQGNSQGDSPAAKISQEHVIQGDKSLVSEQSERKPPGKIESANAAHFSKLSAQSTTQENTGRREGLIRFQIENESKQDAVTKNKNSLDAEAKRDALTNNENSLDAEAKHESTESSKVQFDLSSAEPREKEIESRNEPGVKALEKSEYSTAKDVSTGIKHQHKHHSGLSIYLKDGASREISKNNLTASIPYIKRLSELDGAESLVHEVMQQMLAQSSIAARDVPKRTFDLTIQTITELTIINPRIFNIYEKRISNVIRMAEAREQLANAQYDELDSTISKLHAIEENGVRSTSDIDAINSEYGNHLAEKATMLFVEKSIIDAIMILSRMYEKGYIDSANHVARSTASRFLAMASEECELHRAKLSSPKVLKTYPEIRIFSQYVANADIMLDWMLTPFLSFRSRVIEVVANSHIKYTQHRLDFMVDLELKEYIGDEVLLLRTATLRDCASLFREYTFAFMLRRWWGDASLCYENMCSFDHDCRYLAYIWNDRLSWPPELELDNLEKAINLENTKVIEWIVVGSQIASRFRFSNRPGWQLFGCQPNIITTKPCLPQLTKSQIQSLHTNFQYLFYLSCAKFKYFKHGDVDGAIGDCQEALKSEAPEFCGGSESDAYYLLGRASAKKGLGLDAQYYLSLCGDDYDEGRMNRYSKKRLNPHHVTIHHGVLKVEGGFSPLVMSILNSAFIEKYPVEHEKTPQSCRYCLLGALFEDDVSWNSADPGFDYPFTHNFYHSWGNALHIFANARRYDLLKLALESPWARAQLWEHDSADRTVLHVACMGSTPCRRTTRFLLDQYKADNPVNIFAPDKYGMTPIHYLLENRNNYSSDECIYILRMLQSRGGFDRLLLKNAFGETVLQTLHDNLQLDLLPWTAGPQKPDIADAELMESLTRLRHLASIIKLILDHLKNGPREPALENSWFRNGIHDLTNSYENTLLPILKSTDEIQTPSQSDTSLTLLAPGFTLLAPGSTLLASPSTPPDSPSTATKEKNLWSSISRRLRI